MKRSPEYWENLSHNLRTYACLIEKTLKADNEVDQFTEKYLDKLHKELQDELKRKSPPVKRFVRG